ncbi:MAG: phage terminase small subunit P27 family [Terriglobales bacterium]
MRKKTPAQHELQNTKARHAEIDGPIFAGSKPKKPADLTPDEETEWKRIVPQLLKRGTLTRVDSSFLEVYVRMYSRWRKVAALAAENPTTEVTWTDKNGEPHSKVIEHPASVMATKLENSLRNMLKELSATPASRERTKPTAQAPPKNAPPDPNSREGIALELDRLYARRAAEQAKATPPPAPEPDLDSAELNAAMEAIS